MKSKSRSKFLFPIIAMFSLLLSSLGGVFLVLGQRQKQEILASDTPIVSPLKVEKVSATINSEIASTKNAYSFDTSESGTIIQSSENEQIRNNELVILHTNARDNKKEIVLVSFNVESLSATYNDGTLTYDHKNKSGNTSYYTLQVNAYLDGKPLLTNETIKDQSASTSKYYYQVLNLDKSSSNPLKYSNGEEVDDPQGKYTFVFEYTPKVGNSVEQTQKQTIDFYVYNSEYFENTSDNKTQPRLYNTQKIGREKFGNEKNNGVNDGTEYNYFNYNNNTVDYDDTSNSTKTTLQYPIISYDAKKYAVRYTHTLYGVKSEYKFIFNGEYDDAQNAKIVVYKDGVVMTSNEMQNINLRVKTNKTFTDIILNNIGEYNITYNYVVENKNYNSATNKFIITGYTINSEISNGYYDTENAPTFVKKENWSTVGDTKLYLFGYQLYYSDYTQANTVNKEFKDIDKNLITDVSFKNSNDKFETTEDLEIETICSTNQAPVIMDYYARMTLDQNANKTKSYYKYWSSKEDYEDSKEPTIKRNITNNEHFTQNGYYQVFIEYQFDNYKYLDGELKDGGNYTHYQFFSFEIKNSEPTIEVKTIDVDNESTNIPTNAFTNKNVSISWSTNTSSFDISPRITIKKHIFGTDNGTWTTVYSDTDADINYAQYGITKQETGNGLLVKRTDEIDVNGLYEVIVNYGPGKHTVIKYRFSIDYTDIQGITTYAITNSSTKANNGTTEYSVTAMQTEKNVINSAFALGWDNKQSGATITASYDFISLEKMTSYSATTDNELPNITSNSTVESIKNEIANLNLKNGYELKSLTTGIPYVKAEITQNKITDINSMRINAGLYIFTIKDSAGNISYKTMFVDNSSPVILSYTEEDDAYFIANNNKKIASRNTIVFWGNNKVISINNNILSNDSVLSDDIKILIKNNYSISNDNNDFYISLTKAQINDNLSIKEQKYDDTKEIDANYQIFYIKYTPEQLEEINNATDEQKQALINQYWNYSDHIHSIKVNDSAKQFDKSNNNRVNNTISEFELEMNSDNSLLMAYVHTSEGTDSNLNSDDRLYQGDIATGDKLYLEWITNEGNSFEVKSIKYYYFPLTFDTTSSNYPYSSQPQTEKELDLTTTTTSTISSSASKVISGEINTEGTSQTLQGLYIIRREYVTNLEQTDVDNVSGDYSPRYYLFIIDRNKVISYSSTNQLIGEKIGLKLSNNYYGYNNYQKLFTGSDFLANTDETSPKFTTSKLAINFINAINTLNKFDTNNKTIEVGNTSLKINNEDTKFNIASQVKSSFLLKTPKIYYNDANKNFTNIEPTNDADELAFRKNGYYKVVLSDNSSNAKLNKIDNSFSFIFQVDIEEPQANIIKYTQNQITGKTEYLFYTEGQENISTNNRNLLVVWNKPTNELGFDAEIDKYNFEIFIKFDSGKEINLTVTNGNLSASGIAISPNATLSITDISTDEQKNNSNFENPTWDYYLDFAKIFELIGNDYSSQSAKYNITLRYVGDENAYSGLSNETPNKYFYTIKSVVFDFNKPSYNFERLFNSDAYLSATNQTIEDFINENSQINIENYAFTVSPSFTLNQMITSADSIWTTNMDTYQMFIRQYDKYASESMANQQSLTPDDPRYENRDDYPNRYRFGENLKNDDNQNVYTNITDYYWNGSENHSYTLQDILASIGGATNNYYEIIERDFAGNYRVYTIFVKEETDIISSANFVLSNTDSTPTPSENSFTKVDRYSVNSETTEITLKNKQELLNAIENISFESLFCQNLVLNSLIDFNNEDRYVQKYITVIINDATNSHDYTFVLYPNGDKEEFIEQINNCINVYTQDTGNIYYITFISSLGEVLKVEHRKPSKDYPAYTITVGDTGFDIEFVVMLDDKNSSAFITEFEAYKAENGEINSDRLENDSNGKAIIQNIKEYMTNLDLATSTFRYTFRMQGNSGSEFWIILKDNFGREKKIRQIIGLTDNEDKIIFSADSTNIKTISAIEKNTETNQSTPVDILYTNSPVNLKYQNVLYSLKVYEMEMSVSVDKNYILTEKDELTLVDDLFTKSLDGIYTYPLINKNTESGIIYKVVFESTQGEIIYYIGYENSLLGVQIIKASDNSSIEVESQQSYTFDKTIYLKFNEQTNDIMLFPVTVTGTYLYLDSANKPQSVDLGVVESGKELNSIGSYTFTISNELGTKLTFFVTIEQKISNNYWITYSINGVDIATLSPSNPKATGNADDPYKYFTIYDNELHVNTSAGYTYEELNQTSNIINDTITISQTKNYKVYKVTADGEKDVKFISITKIAVNSNFIRSYKNTEFENYFTINTQIQLGNEVKITQDQETQSKTAILAFNRPYNIVEGNSIYVGYYLNGNFVREVSLANLNELSTDLHFVDSGVYEFYIRDFAGNKQVFGNNSYFKMILLNDFIFTVNSNEAVDNSVFNGNVTVTLLQINQFDSSSITLNAKLNGKTITVPRTYSNISNAYNYTFSDYGLYNLIFTGTINQQVITTNFAFRIINTNEAMATFEYIGLNNYEITKVIRLATKDSVQGDDITQSIKDELGIPSLTTLALSTYQNGIGGIGFYEITVEARYNTNKPNQTFSFKVWLNNDSNVLIKCSIPLGSSTTKEISLSLNKNQIYSKVGECKIMFNDDVWLEINSSTATQNVIETYSVKETGVYNVRVVTNSGNTLESFIITKNEPLNSVAIIVIVISVIAVGALTFIFIKLRKNMKVK